MQLTADDLFVLIFNDKLNEPCDFFVQYKYLIVYSESGKENYF